MEDDALAKDDVSDVEVLLQEKSQTIVFTKTTKNEKEEVINQ